MSSKVRKHDYMGYKLLEMWLNSTVNLKMCSHETAIIGKRSTRLRNLNLDAANLI